MSQNEAGVEWRGVGDNREQSNMPQTYEEAMMKPITLYTVLHNSFLIKGEVG